MKYLATLVTLFLPFQLFAQFYMSGNQQLVVDAVKEAMFISRQSYTVVANSDAGVQANEDVQELGVQYTLGVKLLGGVCLNDAAVRPWLYDDSNAEYGDTHRPVCNSGAYFEVADTVKRGELLYDTTAYIDVIKNTLYWFPVSNFESHGLRPDTTLGDKEGWLVWLSVKKDTQKESFGAPQFVAYKKNFTISSVNNSFIIDAPTAAKDLLGAIYVVPTVTKVGTIEFRLCGIVYPQKDGWRLYSPFFRFGIISDHFVLPECLQSVAEDNDTGGSVDEEDKKKKN